MHLFELKKTMCLEDYRKWLHFLASPNQGTETLSARLLEMPEVKRILKYLQEHGLSRKELAKYEAYWNGISWERTLIEDAYNRGEQKGEKKNTLAIARRMKSKGYDNLTIAELTGLNITEVEQL